MEVTLKEEGYVFTFGFVSLYFNSRLTDCSLLCLVRLSSGYGVV